MNKQGQLRDFIRSLVRGTSEAHDAVTKISENDTPILQRFLTIFPAKMKERAQQSRISGGGRGESAGSCAHRILKLSLRGEFRGDFLKFVIDWDSKSGKK